MSYVRAIALAAALALASRASAEPVYFLVSEIPGQGEHGDSFVLPIENPDDIAHARDLVRFGTSAGRSLIDADIVAGADNINRDILAAGKPAWSWHVSNFSGFADLSIELTDGWPGFIESDVQGWIDNTGGGTVDNDGDGIPDGPATIGHIAFWNYTVTHELTGPATDLSIAPSVVVPLPTGFGAGAAMSVAGAAAYLASRRRFAV
jgi:hypothetical protein